MPQKLSINGFKGIENISQFSEHFIENYNKDSYEGQFVEVDVQYLENLHIFHNDFTFLPERMKIENVEYLAASLYDKKGYIIHIRN